MAGVIETERELLAAFDKLARELLGPKASKAEIDAWVHEAYYDGGPTPVPPETPEAKRKRERETAEAIRLMDQWNVPEL